LAPLALPDALPISCGRWREDDDGTPTVIDVTSDEPVIVGPAEGDGGWRERGRGIFEYRSPDGGSRVFVSRGGVGCLVALLVPLILLCCVCVAVWQGTDWLFDVNFP
jgi:hypothetical protein